MRKILAILALACSMHAYANGTYSAIIYDPVNSYQIAGQGVAIQRPMASLTKLMTAMVSLDYDRNLSNKIGNRSKEELFKALLVRSNNDVAELLSKNYPGGRKAFIEAMNNKAHSIGMSDTHFDDPSGRIKSNVSTAQDVAMMVTAAYTYPEIKRISTYKSLYSEHKVKKAKKYKTVVAQQPNTNYMILNEFGSRIEVSKTGFTNPAGYCVGVVVRHDNQPYVLVIMGARNPKHRLEIIRDLYWTDIAHALTT